MSRIPQQTHDVKQRQQNACRYIEELLDAAGCPKNEWAHYSQYAVDRECLWMHFKRRLGGAYNVLEIVIQTGPRLWFQRKGGILINGEEHDWDSAVAEIRQRYADYRAALESEADHD